MAFDEIRRVVRTDEEIKERRDKHEQDIYEREQRKIRIDSKKSELKASWAKISDETAIEDLKNYLNIQRNGLVDIAISAIGVKEEVYQDSDGTTKVRAVNVVSTPDQRLSNLDRAAGIDIVIAYLERNIG